MFYLHCVIFAAGDALSDYFDSRTRRNEGKEAFSRSIRRTLPFQLVPQPPLAYARSSNYVGEPQAVAINTDLDEAGTAAAENFEQGKITFWCWYIRVDCWFSSKA